MFEVKAYITCSNRRQCDWQVLCHLTTNIPEMICCDAVSMQVSVIGFSVTYVNIKEHLHHALSTFDDAAEWYPDAAQDGPNCPSCAA